MVKLIKRKIVEYLENGTFCPKTAIFASIFCTYNNSKLFFVRTIIHSKISLSEPHTVVQTQCSKHNFCPAHTSNRHEFVEHRPIFSAHSNFQPVLFTRCFRRPPTLFLSHSFTSRIHNFFSSRLATNRHNDIVPRKLFIGRINHGAI